MNNYSKTLKLLLNDIKTLPTDELLVAANSIRDIVNFRRKMELNTAKGQLYIGATCTVDHPKAKGRTFIVEKINIKNVICYEKGTEGPFRKTWRINARMLKVIPSTATAE